MVQTARTFSNTAPVLVAWFAVVLVFCTVRARQLRRTEPGRAALGRALLEGALLAAAGTVTAVALMPFPSLEAPGRMLVLDPFGPGARGTDAEVVLNALFLTPLGVLVSWRWPGARRVAPAAGVALAVPVTLELLQYLSGWGRVASSWDVLVGAAGYLAGWLVVAVPSAAVARTRRAAPTIP